MSNKKFGFCHGWMFSPFGFGEVTCKRRECCRYYDVDFYKNHGNHLDDFEEMFPMEPCPFFLAMEEKRKTETIESDPLDVFCGIAGD